MRCARAARLRRPRWRNPQGADRDCAGPGRGHHLRLQRGAAARRRRRRPRRATARSWWSAAPWTASSRSRARPAISTACRNFAAPIPTATCRPTRWWRCAPAARARRARRCPASRSDEHPDVTLAGGDRVIFSSRTIPGNERRSAGSSTGSSARASRSSPTAPIWCTSPAIRAAPRWRDLYSWVRPRIAVPVHGEALHLAEHADLARKAGVAAGGDLRERRRGAARAGAGSASSTRWRRGGSTRTAG